MTARIAIMLAILGAMAASSSGCSVACDECQAQYDDCVKSAPPGASRADCEAEYEECTRGCRE